MADSSPHLDLIELDALRAGEPIEAASTTHLEDCAACRAALSELIDLAGGLKALHDPGFADNAERDERILWLARGHAARVRMTGTPAARRIFSSPPAWAAAAAAVLVLASAMFLARRPHSTPAEHDALIAAPPVQVAAADLDHDGRVTVLDAFALARSIDAQRADRADVNHDERIDERDVDAMMAMAVSLRGS